MRPVPSRSRARRLGPVAAAVAALVIASTAFAATTGTISADLYLNTTSQHATQVEPDSFAFGSTIVAAVQTGRFTNGGSSNVCWATSTNAGGTWANGCLPGTTTYASPAGLWARVTDPSVAYDAQDNVWLISTLALDASVNGAAVLTSRSTDGGLTWGNPVTTAAVGLGQDFDKNWIACDNTATSPFYGNCYTEWDDYGAGDRILMSTSTDGGLNWGPQRATANTATGLGGQPLVQPNGTVIVPAASANEGAIIAFQSTNGGASWSATTTVATTRFHNAAGGLRSGPLPSAEIDGAGKVYVAWQDCRFRQGCKSNDIVMSTSTNGTTWSAVTRVPIDNVTSKVDHFIPGLAVDPATSGGAAHLALAYYFYPNAKCSVATCQLKVGFVSSHDGGTNWSAPQTLAGPMSLSWIASTTQGPMVGDYISTSFTTDGLAHPLFVTAAAKSGTTFAEALATVAGGVSVAVANAAVSGLDQAVVSAGDHPASVSAVRRE